MSTGGHGSPPRRHPPDPRRFDFLGNLGNRVGRREPAVSLHTARVTRRLAIGAALVVVLAACNSPEPTPSSSSVPLKSPALTPMPLVGWILLWDEDAWPEPAPDMPCSGVGAWDALVDGATVVVLDPAGDRIATGSVDGGIRGPSSQCTFTFFVEELPYAESYTLLIGEQEPLTYSRAELKSADPNQLSVDVRLGYD